MASSGTERLLTAAELGELLGLSASTVLRRWQYGHLPGFRLYGKRGGPVRFRLSEVEAALDGWRGPAKEALVGLDNSELLSKV